MFSYACLQRFNTSLNDDHHNDVFIDFYEYSTVIYIKHATLLAP